MWLRIKQFGGWLKSIPSEPNGTGSSSRICMLLLTGTICYLIYSYYCYHGYLPDDDTLFGLAAMLTAVAGAYGINKFTNQGCDKDKE
jgi:hypothetical protein